MKETQPEPILSTTGRALPKRWLATIVVIWAGQAASIFTSYAASFAAVWYVTETTGSAIMLSVLSICAFLPQGLLSPYGGVLADRYNRKLVIIAADMATGLASLVLGLCIMAGHVSVALVIVMVTARSAAQAFHSPAMMALMPMLVPEKHLVRINSLDAMLLSIAGMICPALGMLLYAAVGFHAVMLLDFAGALVACAALSLAKLPATHAESEQAQQSNAQSEPSTHSGAGTTPARKPFGDMREGWQALRANRGVFLVVVFITLSMMTFGPMSALYPLMTYDYFSGDGIMAACAEGFFAGGLLVGTIIIMIWGGGKRLALLLAVSCTSFGLFCMAAGCLSPDMFWAFVALCALMGVVSAWFNGPMMALVQRAVPEEKLGRVMGFVTALMGLATPLGVAVGGLIAESTGVAPFFIVDGIACALIGLAIYAPKSVRELDA